MANFNFFLNRQGIQGRKGEKGDTGFSPTISVGTDTLDEYKLIIANESNSFETPNLRGNINIQDNGGTYLRYDTETKQISAQSIDAATADTLGGVRLSTEADIVEMGADSVVTPSDVADALPLYLEGEGAVTITQDELTSKTKIKVDVSSVNALESRMSTAEAEIADIQTDVADLNNNKVAKTDLATTESAGIVKVDGTSITVTADGTISASPSDTLPIASTTQLGGVKVDGTSIIADKNGVISSVGGGSAGDVTANGNNVFTGDNKFKKDVTIDCNSYSGSSSLALVDSAVDPNTDCATLRMDHAQGLTINSYGEGIKLNTYLSRSQIKMNKNGDIYFTSQNPLMHNDFRGNGISVPLINQDNIKAGENITLNKNAETGDITISSTGGGGGTGDVPIATTETAGKVKPDGTTITITDDGTISAVAGGGSAPANMVTTDTEQTITANKTFSPSSVVTFGAGEAKTTIEEDFVKIGGDYHSIALLPGNMIDENGSYINTGMITSKVGTINIVPNWRFQHSGDGLVIQQNSFRFNRDEVITKSASDNEYMAHMSMPSNRYEILTLGASGASYTAPDDGYFCFESDATTATGQYCRLIGVNNERLRQSSYSSDAGQYLEVLMPVSKGEIIQTYYTAPEGKITFMYAEGAR